MPDGASSKHHTAKILFYSLGGIFFLFLLILFFLPLFFSTLGKDTLLKIISNRAGVQCKVETLSLSWFGSQSAKGIYISKEGEFSFSSPEITTDASLWRLYFKNDLGEMHIQDPNLQVIKPFNPFAHAKSRPLQAASFFPKVHLGVRPIDLPAAGHLSVEHGKISFNPPGIEPVVFDEVALILDLTDVVKFQLNSMTEQQGGRGEIAVNGTATQLKSSSPQLALQATLSSFPVAGLDQLISMFYPKLNGIFLSGLGNTVDLQCHFNSTAGNFELDLDASSPLMMAQIATQSKDGVLSLKENGVVNFKLLPPLFQKLSKIIPSLQDFALVHPVSLEGTLIYFSCPLPMDKKDLLSASFEGSIIASDPIDLTLYKNPLALNNFNLKASSPSWNQGINLDASAAIQNGGQSGSFTLNGTWGQNKKNLTINSAKFPVDLLGVFISAPLPLSTILGSAADFTCDLTGGENAKLQLSWRSPFLQIPSLDIALDTTWTLISPSAFSFQWNQSLFDHFAPNAKLQLVNAAPMQGTLQTLIIPSKNFKNTQIEAIVNSGPITLTGGFPLHVNKMQASLMIHSLNQISVQIDADPLKAFLSGSLHLETKEFVMNKPLTVQYPLDEALLKAWIPSASGLLKPALVQFSLDPMTLPLTGLSLTKAKGQLSTAELTLGQISLQNVTLPFQWDGTAKTASVQLTSRVQNPSKETGTVQGQLTLANFSAGNFTNANLQASLDLQNISSALIEAFSGRPGISALTGPTFSGHFTWQSIPDKQNIAIKWTSPYLNIDSAFVIQGGSLQLQANKNQIQWTLTPQGYKVLDQMLTGPTKNFAPFEIKEPSTFSISLAKVILPVTSKTPSGSLTDRFPELSWDLSKLQLAATGSNPKLIFFDNSSHETIQLSSMAFSLQKSGAAGPLTVSLNSGVTTQSSLSNATGPKTGNLALKGSLTPTFNAEGNYDLSKLTGDLDLNIQQFPSRVLDILARGKGRTDLPFTTIFGDVINATLNTSLKNFNGPVTLNVNSPMTRASLKGSIAGGALMLQDTIYAQMRITPEISRLIFKEINPLNLSSIYSNDPITLEIPDHGFYFPLYPFNLEKIAIPDATIELGKISCRNEGNVNIALGLLKSKQFDKKSDLTLWFAPIDLKVQKGYVDFERTEILLADTYDVCIWGTIDLVEDYVDMILGLTAQTLSTAFGIKNLPEDYVLTLPMRGPPDDVEINTGKATAKVALLLAWQKADVGGALSKNPAGAIVGGLINKMATLPDQNANVPPAKHPFPWEIGNMPKKKTSHAPNEKRRKFKQNERPLKQILKVIR